MDALLTSFIAVALGQWGNKTQWLIASLSARYRRPGPILAGAALAAIGNALIAAYAGRVVHAMITPRILSLLLAMALAFAAVEGLLGRRPKPIAEGWRTGSFLTSLACVFLVGFADKGQFITFSLSAYYDAPWLAAAGAAAGTIAASIPAALLGERFDRVVPVRAISIGVGLIFLVSAFIVAISALRLT